MIKNSKIVLAPASPVPDNSLGILRIFVLLSFKDETNTHTWSTFLVSFTDKSDNFPALNSTLIICALLLSVYVQDEQYCFNSLQM